MDNQKIAEILLKLQMEDLNDADMLAEYAKEIEELGDVAIAQAIANRAKTRLSQMAECDHSIKLLMQRVQSDKAAKGEPFNEDSLYAVLYKKHVESNADRVRKKLESM